MAQACDGRRGPHLPVDTVGAVLAPQLREVLQAVAPVLAAASVELLIRILARLKQVQVLLDHHAPGFQAGSSPIHPEIADCAPQIELLILGRSPSQSYRGS